MQTKRKEPRKKVIIFGDSVAKSLNQFGLSKNQNVKVQGFSEYTTEDMLDIVKPAARRKPDAKQSMRERMTLRAI